MFIKRATIFYSSPHSKEGLVNIVTEKIITDPMINVHESLTNGEKMMQKFEASLPEGFYEPIKQKYKDNG